MGGRCVLVASLDRYGNTITGLVGLYSAYMGGDRRSLRTTLLPALISLKHCLNRESPRKTRIWVF